MESIWKQDIDIPGRPPFEGHKSVQAAVIGAGLAGILTAYFLQQAGVEVVVLEAKRIGSGQTGNTTAKITSQHGLCYERLIRTIGRQNARAYAMANEDAIRSYEKVIGKERIACRFEHLPSYLYTTKDTNTGVLGREAKAAVSLGIAAQYVEGRHLLELPFQAAGAVRFDGQAQFHPLEFLRCLADKLEVYENSEVLSVNGHMISTEKGTLHAEHIIFATHYPFTNVPGFYFLRMHQERSYVLGLSGADKLSGMYISMDDGGLSLRSAEDVLLLGGGNHRTGKRISDDLLLRVEEAGRDRSVSMVKGGVGYSYLRMQARRYYPGTEIIAQWSAQDCMPHDGIPFIGRYSKLRPYWYVVTGFKKWGMTSSMVAARIISDAVLDRENPYERVFGPQRFFFRASVRKLLMDIGESAVGLTKGLFAPKGMRCPHMGCRLVWNPVEESWDCPCHGSRFAEDGKLIDNPAQIDLKRG